MGAWLFVWYNDHMNTTIFSLLLSSFFSVFLFVQIYLRNRFDFDLIKVGRTIALPSKTAVSLFVAVGAIGAGIAYFAMIASGPVFLQIFYIALFAISFWIGIFFVVPAKSAWHRLCVGFGIATLLLWLVLVFQNTLFDNTYMVSSLLWVAPFIFWRWNIKRSHFIVFILVFMAIDIFNIYVGEQKMIFSDEFFSLNGMIRFGEFELGIGDFIFGYLTVEAAVRYSGKGTAVALAVLLSLPRFLIRIIVPDAAGMVFPYTMFMVPIVLVALGYWKIKKNMIA